MDTTQGFPADTVRWRSSPMTYRSAMEEREQQAESARRLSCDVYVGEVLIGGRTRYVVELRQREGRP